MKTPRLKRLLGAGLAITAFAATALATVPAGAAPPGTVITAAGSDTTEKLMDAILDGSNEYNVSAIQSPDKTVPGDANCDNDAGAGFGSFTYRGRPPGTPAIPAPFIESPQGSSAGRNALRDSLAGANGNYPTPGNFGKGCVDIARSSAEPRAINATNDLATFEYYGFALDAVGWSSPSLKAPSALTLQQVRDIYNCVVTNWSQVGGADGHIQRVFPSSTSGTGATFISKVLGGVAPVTSGVDCPAMKVVEENHGDFLTDPSKGGDPTLYQEMILPYSQGKWVYHANNPTNPTVDIRNGVRVGAIYTTTSPAPAAPVYAVNWTGTSWFLNTATTAVSEANPNLLTPFPTAGVYPGVRYLYNVIDPGSPSYSVSRGLVGFDSIGGTRSPLCNGDEFSEILSQGFLNLQPRNVGSATNVTCIVKNP